MDPLWGHDIQKSSYQGGGFFGVKSICYKNNGIIWYKWLRLQSEFMQYTHNNYSCRKNNKSYKYALQLHEKYGILNSGGDIWKMITDIYVKTSCYDGYSKVNATEKY